ncbi:ceramidase domain-containing protein [Sporocytophaga myxococcoides]|uniref:ceramidase domain-containing protein n=1 Tax=Sporocytophaga myxococcoides TaxID=153721 RepID=UPI00138AD918|nr:ceramidase domain-containing protein [Sporocytophaga myxococcoides]
MNLLSLENKKTQRLKALLTLLAVTSLIFLILHGPIPQSASYHSFADHSTFYGIRNFYNVVSNFPFFIIGAVGIIFILKNDFLYKSARLCFFIGIFLTGLGSAYYHYDPSTSTLVWDRLPMTITFMSFFSFILFRNFSFRNHDNILILLLLTGIASVIFWYTGELRGSGDLRLYALVQFYPVVAIIIILLWNGKDRQMFGVIFWYIAAKVFEATDQEFLSLTEVISGHTIKHLMAACAAVHLLVLFYIEYKSLKKIS